MSTKAVLLETNRESRRTESGKGSRSAPREIGHPAAIRRGTVLVKPGTPLPENVTTSLRRVGSWNMIDMESFAIARALSKENLHFSFVVPAIKKTAWERTREKALRSAMEKLVKEVTANNFNALEVTSVATRRLPGMYRVEITGHPSHISDSPFLDERHGLPRKESASEFVTHHALLETANEPQRSQREGAAH